ncbi:MAG: carbon storage regulator CsrA [Candidatus Velthaea sp.]|jgi:carbon storage regulator
MLVLSRKLNQAIMVGDNVRIVVVSVDRDQVKLGIDAPREIPVHRSEVYEEIQRVNRAAAGLPAEPSAAPSTTEAAPVRPGRSVNPAALSPRRPPKKKS